MWDPLWVQWEALQSSYRARSGRTQVMPPLRLLQQACVKSALRCSVLGKETIHQPAYSREESSGTENKHLNRNQGRRAKTYRGRHNLPSSKDFVSTTGLERFGCWPANISKCCSFCSVGAGGGQYVFLNLYVWFLKYHPNTNDGRRV